MLVNYASHFFNTLAYKVEIVAITNVSNHITIHLFYLKCEHEDFDQLFHLFVSEVYTTSHKLVVTLSVVPNRLDNNKPATYIFGSIDII